MKTVIKSIPFTTLFTLYITSFVDTIPGPNRLLFHARLLTFVYGGLKPSPSSRLHIALFHGLIMQSFHWLLFSLRHHSLLSTQVTFLLCFHRLSTCRFVVCRPVNTVERDGRTAEAQRLVVSCGGTLRLPNHSSACVCFSAGRKQPGVVLRPIGDWFRAFPAGRSRNQPSQRSPSCSTLDGDWRRAADRGYFWCFGGETTYTAVGRRPLLTNRARFDVFFVDFTPLRL